MIETPAIHRTREGTWLWLYKIVAGVLIIIVLIAHLLVNHLLAPGGLLTYADVVAYYQNPFIPIMEAFFLIFVVSHAMVGMRSILLDLNPSNGVLKAADIVLWLVGTVAVIYGLWLIWAIIQQG